MINTPKTSRVNFGIVSKLELQAKFIHDHLDFNDQDVDDLVALCDAFLADIRKTD